MRILLIVLAAACARAQILAPISANVVHSSTGFFSRSITIDHTKVPNTNQTNFPVLVGGTYTYLKTVGNGGKVTSASGYDVLFGTTATCSARLDWEIVNWGASTGTVEYWVRVPTLTTSTDYVFYMCYGDASVTTNQSNRTGTWNSAFKLVLHYPNGSSLTANDSTSNAYNGTITAATAATGQIDGAAAHDGITSDISFPNGTGDDLNMADPSSTSCWVNRPGGAGDQVIIFNKRNGQGWLFYVASDDKLNFNYYGGTGGASSGTVSASGWHHLGFSFTGGTGSFYIDGALSGTASVAPLFSPSSTLLHNAVNLDGSGNITVPTDPTLDDCRVSTAIRSADWMATEHNTGDPSSFYAVGSEVPH